MSGECDICNEHPVDCLCKADLQLRNKMSGDFKELKFICPYCGKDMVGFMHSCSGLELNEPDKTPVIDKRSEHALDCSCHRKECIGLLGSIFGHSFRRYLKKERYVQQPNVSFDIHGVDNVKEFLESQRDIYIIRCKRCGAILM